MLKLILTLATLPFFLYGGMEIFVIVWSWIEGWRLPRDYQPSYAYMLVAVLWVAFVHSASAELEAAANRVKSGWENFKDFVFRRRRYHPDYWWHNRYPGDLMISWGERHPMFDDHFKKWKADMIAQGYGPGKKDPGLREPWHVALKKSAQPDKAPDAQQSP